MGSLGTLPDPLDINDRTDTTITAADEIVYADATDSAAIKKDTVQGILDLVPAVADNAITLAKMASGTDGNIISYDASGDPVAIATGSDGQVLTSAGAGAPPAFETVAAGGKCLQIKYALNNTYSATGSVTTPAFDDSIPQNNEGIDVGVNVAITPGHASNILVLEASVSCSHSASGEESAFILQDSTANAIAATKVEGENASGGQHDTIICRHVMLAGTTSETTFKVRAGSPINGTFYLNGGQSSGRKFGGVMYSSLVVTEYTP